MSINDLLAAGMAGHDQIQAEMMDSFRAAYRSDPALFMRTLTITAERILASRVQCLFQDDSGGVVAGDFAILGLRGGRRRIRRSKRCC